MTRVVYKYELSLSDEPTVLRLPSGKPVHFAIQRSVPCLWVEVDPHAHEEVRVFRIFGTGHPVRGEYIDTAYAGPFVWHCYEVTDAP